MTVRGKLLTVALALGLSVAPARAQRPADDVTPQDIQELQQQLAGLAALQGMNADDAKRLVEQFQRMQQQNGGRLKWDDFLKQNAPNLPKPPVPRPPVQADPNPPIPPRPRPVDPPQVPPFNPDRRQQIPPFNFDQPDPRMDNFNPPDPRGNNPDAQAMMKFWEQNVGPLENTPAVRDAILDLFNAGQGGEFANGDWKNFLDEFNQNGGNNEGFGDWLKEMNFEGGKWDFPQGGDGWDFPKWDWGWGGKGGGGGWGGGNNGGGGGGWNWGGGGGGGFSGGGGGSWLPVILLLVIAVGGLIAWKLWPMLKNRESAAAEAVRAINRWPVDPRTINSRAELVKAFEYLSVLLCGDAARVWNHETIAKALRLQIPRSELVADELAKLYELARYTPAGEPLSPGALADARRCLCHLAGVSA